MRRLWVLWDHLDLRALLDIGIMATVMFLLARTLRASGAGRVTQGILLAGGVFLLAYTFELRGIMWVYSRLSPVLLVAGVVIFQPELRRILEQGASLRASHRHGGSDEFPEMICECLERLLQKHWGAILVFPGKQPLTRWIAGGVRLEGHASVPLLLSLFDPHSPGHDGAVIFEADRIASFANRLPLSQTDRLDPQLGTRHNASMGLSEVTDALVVTVSEERGTITVFEGGTVTALPTSASAGPVLRQHAEAVSRPGFTSDRKRSGFQLSLHLAASVLVAILLWADVTLPSGKVVERSLEVPIEYATPETLALVGTRPKVASLHIAGDETTLRELDVSRLSVRLDLRAARTGQQTIIITEGDVPLPKAVQLLAVEPSSLEVTLQQIAERDLVIVPQIVGTLPPGFHLRDVTVVPPTLRAVTHPGPDGSEDRHLGTSPIYLHGLTADTTLTVKVVASAGIQPPDRRWPDVQVQLSIEKRGD